MHSSQQINNSPADGEYRKVKDLQRLTIAATKTILVAVFRLPVLPYAQSVDSLGTDVRCMWVADEQA